MSQNTSVYRYRGISVTVYYRRAFLDTAHLYLTCTVNRYVRGFRVVFGPDTNVLVEVMWTEDGRISSQVVEVVHDDGHEQIQHLGEK